jgi:hypothetical protein
MFDKTVRMVRKDAKGKVLLDVELPVDHNMTNGRGVDHYQKQGWTVYEAPKPPAPAPAPVESPAPAPAPVQVPAPEEKK